MPEDWTRTNIVMVSESGLQDVGWLDLARWCHHSCWIKHWHPLGSLLSQHWSCFSHLGCQEAGRTPSPPWESHILLSKDLTSKMLTLQKILEPHYWQLLSKERFSCTCRQGEDLNHARTTFCCLKLTLTSSFALCLFLLLTPAMFSTSKCSWLSLWLFPW